MTVVPRKLNKFIILGLVTILLFTPVSIFASDLLIVPDEESVQVDENLSLLVSVNSTDNSIKNVSGVINFPSDKLEITSVSKSGSIVDFWITEPFFSNNNGTLEFEGVILDGGFKGINGNILILNFLAKEGGEADVELVNGTLLANDNFSTNVVNNFGSSKITIDVIEEEVDVVVPSITGDADKKFFETEVVVCSNIFCRAGFIDVRDEVFVWGRKIQNFFISIFSIVGIILIAMLIFNFAYNKFYRVRRDKYLEIKKSQEEIAMLLGVIHNDLNKYIEQVRKIKTYKKSESDKEEMLNLLNQRLTTIKACSTVGLDYIKDDVQEDFRKEREVLPLTDKVTKNVSMNTTKSKTNKKKKPKAKETTKKVAVKKPKKVKVKKVTSKKKTTKKEPPKKAVSKKKPVKKTAKKSVAKKSKKKTVNKKEKAKKILKDLRDSV